MEDGCVVVLISLTVSVLAVFSLCLYKRDGGHAVAQWLRRYATSQKVAGSRPDKANYSEQLIKFFRPH
jgi:hypothetical protein